MPTVRFYQDLKVFQRSFEAAVQIYELSKSFIAKLTDSEGEVRETQTGLQFALACRYISEEQFNNLNNQYNQIIGMLGNMLSQSEKWCSFSSDNNPEEKLIWLEL
ncbi:four helix bundle protein [Chryseobacterium sp. 52]|uniref:four helix bundle protein n=1 Tax=Chryseobacterium sp. 52 TaxID=2035213 RepID=UPI000C1891F0|nr:four helix bundle protein [Chryseobacterium sp. 52]PIF43273.1 four helix bundle protein [Chryseobacterium sp. 52]